MHAHIHAENMKRLAKWLARPRNSHFDTVAIMLIMSLVIHGRWLAAITALLVGSVVSVGLRIYAGLLDLSQDEQP